MENLKNRNYKKAIIIILGLIIYTALIIYLAATFVKAPVALDIDTNDEIEVVEEVEEVKETEVLEEETEEIVEAETIEPTEFSVEYWEGDGGVITLEAILPEGTIVHPSPEEATSIGTILTFGESTLTFTIPHSGGEYYFVTMQEIINSNIPDLYRVGPSELLNSYYTSTISFDEKCLDNMNTYPGEDEYIPTPCGNLTISNEKSELVVIVQLNSANLTDVDIANQIMSTLQIIR